LIHDDSFFNLVTGWIYTGPWVMAPAIVMGSHDNIDGFNELPPMIYDDDPLYFSVHAAEIVVPPCSGFQSGHIYVVFGGVMQIFAPAASMGINAVDDSIDALVVWDLDNDGYYEPYYDYAIYSLAPGSVTLMGNPLWDGGTVFWTNFNGTSTVYAWAPNLGVGTFPAPPLLGTDGEPNVDGLEINPSEWDPGEPGDPDGTDSH
jgi:hypothetical protein